MQYRTEPVVRGELRVVVTATGSVQPRNQVDVSSELSGTVRRVHVDFNDKVRAGEVLAELDTERLQASVESSRARLAAAQARASEADVTVQETQREAERLRRLADREFSSAQALEAAQARHERALAARASAGAEIGVAQADYSLNRANLAKARITSPIDGVVLVRSVEPGQTVAASLQAPVLFSIAEDLAQMEVNVAVDEADVGRVKEGQRAALSVDAYPDRDFPAGIRELRYSPEIVQGVVTYTAVLTVDNAELLLRPGMTATASITVHEQRDAPLVPNAALRFTPPEPTAESAGGLRSLLPHMPAFRAPSAHELRGRERSVWCLEGGHLVAVPIEVGPSDGRWSGSPSASSRRAAPPVWIRSKRASELSCAYGG